ncbi:DUF2807 domain-containing protein [bacterium]|nr:DUF2807 domain-containing protein [bacterium]
MERKLVVSLMLLALFTGSCNMLTIEGSGDITTETREVSGFERVGLSNMGVVVLTQGETEGLTVRADDNLMKYVVTEVHDGTLRIGLTSKVSQGLLRPTEPIVFDVSVRDLSGLSVSGSGSIEVGRLVTDLLAMSVSGSGSIDIGDLTADEVTAAISGSGQVSAAGEARVQTVSVSGSGGYRAQDLVTRESDVSVSGSGLVALNAAERLDVRISGSGTVRYSGEPGVTEDISGSGRLERVDSPGTSP